MTVIDFHTHAFPGKIAARAIASLSATSGDNPAHDGTVADLLRLERRAGVEEAVLLPVMTRPAQFESVNRFAAQMDRLPGLRSFGGIHPDCENLEEKIAAIAAMGLRGVKLHPDYQGAFIDDPRYIRIARAALREGLAVLTHAGRDPVSPNLVHCPPERAARFYEEATARLLPRERESAVVIFAHLGGAGMDGSRATVEEIISRLAGSGAVFDLSYALTRLDSGAALRLIRAMGADHVLFGSDAPWGDPAATLAALDALPLTANERALILSGNARRILG